MWREIQGIAMLSGTILGVGIFSLPYLLHAVGLIPMFGLFAVLAGLILFLQRAVGHMVANTEGTHLIPGYIGKFLGSGGKFLSFFTSLFGLLFAMVAYLIVGGVFLADLFQNSIEISPIWWAGVMFILGGYFILRGARTVARVELLFLGLFLILFLLLGAFGFSAFDASRLPATFVDNPFLAFGGILFAMWGMAVIPELKRILGSDEKRIKRVITISFLLTLFMSISFMVLIAGITGTETTDDSLTGLQGILDSKVISLVFIFGFIAVFTSYMSLGVTLRDAMHYDFHIPWSASFLIAAVLPFFLYFLGITSLIGVISLSGIIFLAAEGVLLSLTLIRYYGEHRGRFMHFQQFLLVVIMVALLIGASLALRDYMSMDV
ncbi:MAG: aromatic amino acid transport family protein [Patescibacteria group bacterium]|jgi:amino acid permease